MALYILYGHQFWARKRLKELLEKAESFGHRIFKITSDSFTPLSEYFSGDLFGKKIVLAGEYLLENPDYEKEIQELLPTLISSSNIIFLLEEEFSEDRKSDLKKEGGKFQGFKNPPEAKFLSWAEGEAEKLEVSLSRSELKLLSEELEYDPWAVLVKLERLSLEKWPFKFKKNLPAPNYFQFADLAAGKKKHPALRLLRAYLRAGLGAEEAFWKLWWKTKTLRLVDSGAKGAGLHPFVLKKASEDIKHFSSEELKNLSYELLDIFSEVRRGETTFEEGLERLLLKL